jgi:hypothetical protein
LLLWRGSRDGFEAKEFHGRCDGHANTLTVILDTKGNIFGGFTPVKSESGDWYWKEDLSLRSFVFTLKNPHNLPARRFGLKSQLSYLAIDCERERGPSFGFNDICVSERRGKTKSFGSTYVNDTKQKQLFTGGNNFEIEDFEVPDFDPLIPPSIVQFSERLDSQIISELPGIFAEFQGK